MGVFFGAGDFFGGHCTWAMFFLMHLASMSCMAPYWASTGSGFVPIWGARVQSHAVLRRLFIVLMTAAHISPNVFFLRNFLSNILRLFFMVQATSFIPIIHYIHTHIYIFYLHFLFTHSLLWFFMAAGCPRSLVSDTWTNSFIVVSQWVFLFCNKPFLRIKNLSDTKPSCDFNRKNPGTG